MIGEFMVNSTRMISLYGWFSSWIFKEVTTGVQIPLSRWFSSLIGNHLSGLSTSKENM